jgi:hypothetical protein
MRLDAAGPPTSIGGDSMPLLTAQNPIAWTVFDAPDVSLPPGAEGGAG